MTEIKEQPKLISNVRVHPKCLTAQQAQTHLSVVDSTTATFGDTIALWVFEHHDVSPSVPPLPSSLILALSETLSAFPHFAGRLGLTPWPSQTSETVVHTERFRRSVVRYGFADDPGVDVQTAKLAVPVTAIFPDAVERSGIDWCWDLSETKLMEMFAPTGNTAGGLEDVPGDSPAVRVRITLFAGNSLAVAIKISHPLADAETMIAFMKAWGKDHSAIARKECPPIHNPIFDPRLLDAQAEGDINHRTPDPAIIKRSRSLPLPWYDWWEHEPGNPVSMDTNPQVVIPPEIPQNLVQSRHRGRRIPWGEWDLNAPVSHCILRFSSDEINTIYDMAQNVASPSGVTISRHDALLAFIWQLTALAKPPSTWPAPPVGEEAPTISLDTTIGLRPRLNLPRTFIGSPILLAGLGQSYALVTGDTSPNSTSVSNALHRHPVIDTSALAATAAAIRTHLARFDGPALAAWLHDMAFDLAPQRWWQGFLGSRHLLATSWIRAGLWEVDFGLGSARSLASVNLAREDRGNPSSGVWSVSRLRWAGVLGPNLDGLVTLIEAESGHGREWWQGGVDVDVKLETEAMGRFRELLASWRQERRSL